MAYSTHPRHLTPSGRLVLEAIWRLSEEHGRPPILRDVCRTLGRAVSTVHHHVVTLARLGLVEHHEGETRGAYVTGAGLAALGETEVMRGVLRQLRGAEVALSALGQEGLGPDDWVRSNLATIITCLEEAA